MQMIYTLYNELYRYMGEPIKEEEVRKIQFTGRSSYILTLPKSWVREMNLNAGDTVTVSRAGSSSLLILPKSLRVEKKPEAVITVAHDDTPSSIARKIVSLYLLGYGNIHIRSKDGRLTSAQRNAIKELVRTKLVGTEIVDDSSEKITLQVLLSLSELSIENAARRMHLIASSMHRDAITAVAERNHEIAKEVIPTDDEVDRFSLYGIRQLKSAIQNQSTLDAVGLKDKRDCLGYRLIIKSLERIADHASSIAENSMLMESPLPEHVTARILEFSKYSLQTLDDAMTSLFKRDYTLADRVVETAQKSPEYEKKIVELAGKFRVKELSGLRVILEDIRRTAEYAGDIAEIVLNLTIENMVTKS